MPINTVCLVGRVGQEPDIKYFESGAVKTRVSLAVSAGKNQTYWFTIECWNKLAELVANYVNKGKQISVTGALKFDTWNDKNTGVPRTQPVINASNIEFLSSPKTNTNQNGYNQQPPQFNNNQQPNNYNQQQYPQPQNYNQQPQYDPHF